jgi:hypothetical protein
MPLPQVPLFRVRDANQDGVAATSFELAWGSWIPIVISLFAATGTFGNFILQVGNKRGWW